MTPFERLECDIEASLANYVGTSYPIPLENGWARIAELFATCIELTQQDESTYSKRLSRNLTRLSDAIASMGV